MSKQRATPAQDPRPAPVIVWALSQHDDAEPAALLGAYRTQENALLAAREIWANQNDGDEEVLATEQGDRGPTGDRTTWLWSEDAQRHVFSVTALVLA